MMIGEKIRSLRIRHGLTQKQLAGDKITRNMLSRIENGAALPSISSLLYIAERLDVSPAYFFEDDGGAPKEIENMLFSLYNNGEYERCISVGSSFPPSEIGNIIAQCYLNIAVRNFLDMKFKKAKEALLRAKEHYESTSNITDTGYNIVTCLLQLANVKSDSDTKVPSPDISPSYKALISNFYLFLLSCTTCYANSPELNKQESFWLHIAARAKISKGEYNKAAEILRLSKDEFDDNTPRGLRYMVYDDLELCSIKTENYREAYEMSRLKHELTDHIDEP